MRGSIALKISAFGGVLLLVGCAWLGLIAYFSGSSAVIIQVVLALLRVVEDAVVYLESQFQV